MPVRVGKAGPTVMWVIIGVVVVAIAVLVGGLMIRRAVIGTGKAVGKVVQGYGEDRVQENVRGSPNPDNRLLPTSHYKGNKENVAPQRPRSGTFGQTPSPPLQRRKETFKLTEFTGATSSQPLLRPAAQRPS